MKKALNFAISAGFMLSIILAVSCSFDDGDSQSNNGSNIESVAIGAQVWMKKNLDVAVDGSKCYDDLQSNCDKYGRLYTWDMAKTACPKGWHLPTYAEWETLINFAGGESVAGKKLKAASGWDSNGNGADEFGFAALPGGFGGSDGSFADAGYDGLWWSASEYDASYAYIRYMDYYIDDIYLNTISVKSSLLSVRCLQD